MNIYQKDSQFRPPLSDSLPGPDPSIRKFTRSGPFYQKIYQIRTPLSESLQGPDSSIRKLTES